jgi:hypothetical protein
MLYKQENALQKQFFVQEHNKIQLHTPMENAYK